MTICNITTTTDADFIRGFSYQYVDATGTPTGPVDLTGNTMRMGIRSRASDIEQDLLLTTENGGLILTDPPNGKFTVYIQKAQLERLPVETFEHSLVRNTAGTPTLHLRVWSGTLTNKAGPSR